MDENPDVTVGGEILAFWVETKTTPLYWDVIGTIEVKITFVPARPGDERLERRLLSRQVKRTYLWPSATFIEGVIDTSVDDLMGQLHSLDAETRKRRRFLRLPPQASILSLVLFMRDP